MKSRFTEVISDNTQLKYLLKPTSKIARTLRRLVVYSNSSAPINSWTKRLISKYYYRIARPQLGTGQRKYIFV